VGYGFLNWLIYLSYIFCGYVSFVVVIYFVSTECNVLETCCSVAEVILYNLSSQICRISRVRCYFICSL